MKKRMLALLISACAVLSLVGCRGNGVKDDVIEVKKYKGLEVDKVKTLEVTDEDIENSINSTLQSMSTTTEITDRAVENGDVVIIDYVGKVDGVEFEGGTAEGASLTIGSGQFIDGFEEAIIGHNIDEVFDINVTFPEEYHSEDLAGKDAVFTITLHKIQQVNVPELTEELVASLSATAKTIDAYKEEVKNDLQVSNEETAKSQLQQNVWRVLIDNCVIENYPEDTMKEMLESLNSQYGAYASMYGMEVEDFVKQMYGITLEDMAHELIKQELAVNLIAKKEGMVLTAEIYDKELAAYAERWGYEDPTEFEERVGRDQMEKMLLQNMVGEFLVENCKQK